MGEPAGVGPELVLNAWHQRDVLHLPSFCYIGCATHLINTREQLGLTAPISVIKDLENAEQAFASSLPVLDCKLTQQVQPGQPHTSNAKDVIEAIKIAVNLTLQGSARAIVTNPIHKKTLLNTGFPFPGHTEFLAHLCLKDGTNLKPAMMLVIPGLRVIPLTVHLPLAQVSQMLSHELITNTARLAAKALKQDFALSTPRLAVAALNPHAGEEGQLGREEIDVIAPAIKTLRAEGLDIVGPYPADTLFSEEARQTYDVALCMYHDQALIPLKTINFYDGVNVTLGLPIIRTSPDHGTAFDIAGQNIARIDSFTQALLLADEIATGRTEAA